MENYVSKLDDQGLLSICSTIPASDFKELFTSNSQKFNKIKGGYNYRKATPENTYAFVIRNKDADFISHFLNKCIDQLLSSIHSEIKSNIADGLQEEAALIIALSHSVFSKNVQLFFELDNRPFISEYISMIEYALHLYDRNEEISTELASNQEKSKHEDDELESQKQEIERLQQSLSDAQALYSRQEEDLAAKTAEVERLRGLSRYIVSAENYEPANGYSYLSLCRTYTDEFGKNKYRLERLADITSDGEIMSGLSEDAPVQKYIYNTSGPKEDGFIGVWNWRATPNPTDPNRLYFESQYDDRFAPVEVIVFDDCMGMKDLVTRVKDGFDYQGNSQRIMIAFDSGTALEGLLCNAKALVDIRGGMLAVSSNVFKLPLFVFHRQDLVSIDGVRYLRFLGLGMPTGEVALKNSLDIVRTIIVNRITQPAMMQKGYRKNEIRQIREFIESIPVDGLYEEIAQACDCSIEEAKGFAEQFITWSESVVAGQTLENSIMAQVIRNDAELWGASQEELRVEWEARNTELLEDARVRLAKAQEEETDCRRRLELAKKEIKRLDTEASQRQAQIQEQLQLASDVERKVQERIEAARNNAAEFIAENAFVHVNTGSAVQARVVEPTASDLFTACFTEGVGFDADELDVNDSWQDVLLTIQSELEGAGVAKEKIVGLAGFMYSAYLNRIPLLLAGPNGFEIARAFSLAVNGVTPSVLRCSGEYQQVELEKCEKAASDIVVIEHPFQHEWYSGVLELFSRRKQFYLAIHPFAEDLAIEPKGILNYCIPVLTDTIVNSAPKMNYIGGRMADSFAEYKRSRTVSRYKDLLSVFRLSNYTKSTVQSLISDIHQMIPEAAVESDYLYVFYPLAYVLGKTDSLFEYIESCDEGSRPPKSIRELIGEQSGDSND